MELNNEVKISPTGMRDSRGAIFRGEGGFDFIGSAEQSIATRTPFPGWRVVEASRIRRRDNLDDNSNSPYWSRNDIFRDTRYQDFQNLPFHKIHATVPSGVILPSGRISHENMKKMISVVLPKHVKYHPNVIKAFSILYQFDTMTQQQLMALMDVSAQETERVINILYKLRVVDTHINDWRAQENLGRIWRLISRKDSHVKSYFDGLPTICKALITGKNTIDEEESAPGSGSRTAIKHNLFALETMLRLAESSPNVAGIWGDPFSSETHFNKEDKFTIQRGSWGDGVIVTKNGSIIILEIVGSLSTSRGAMQTIAEKTASWVGNIAVSSLDINVLFVNTTWHDDWEYMNRAVMVGTGELSKKYAPEEYSREKAVKHIGVVDARKWFPEPASVSFAGTVLAGYSPHERLFKRYDLPDPSFSTPELRRNIVMNTATALHTPSWMGNRIVPRYEKAEDRYKKVLEQYSQRGINE